MDGGKEREGAKEKTQRESMLKKQQGYKENEYQEEARRARVPA